MLTDGRRSGRARRAFTLIELLIVIAILLALGGLVVVNLIPKQQESEIKLTRVQIDQFESALKMFMIDMKRYPTEDEGLAALWREDVIEDEDEARLWAGPYTEEPKPTDAWNSEWVYRNPSQDEGFPYDIVSLGPDREEETEDDITNHDRFRDEEGEISEEFSDFGTAGDSDATGGT